MALTVSRVYCAFLTVFVQILLIGNFVFIVGGI
jgi:hypothetical protein